jgi:hypothetical protein
MDFRVALAEDSSYLIVDDRFSPLSACREGLKPADSVEKVGFEFRARKVRA